MWAFLFGILFVVAGDHVELENVREGPAPLCGEYKEAAKRIAKREFGLPPAGSSDPEDDYRARMKEPRRPGHSKKGIPFDEGPRRRARKLAGVGKVHWPVTTASKEAQAFFDQGLALLHGYAFREAERAFREALARDEGLVMAYWGMAMAARGEGAFGTRSKALLQKALDGAKGKALSPAEREWLDAYRGKDLAGATAAVARKFPDEIELAAFHVYEAMLASPADEKDRARWRTDTDETLKRLLAKAPDHPAHHYVIHLWDGADPKRALESARRIGFAAPGVAHMWHMPTHAYAELGEDAKALWHEEASQRTDNAYLRDDGGFPFEIHNYAHNLDRLIDRAESLGRIRLARDLAAAWANQPTHRIFEPSGMSSPESIARGRYLSLLESNGLWQDLLALRDTSFFALEDDFYDEVYKLRRLALAYLHTGNREGYETQLRHLACIVAIYKDDEEASSLRKLIATVRLELAAVEAVKSGDKARAGEAVDRLEKAMPESPGRIGSLRKDLGDWEPAVRLLAKARTDFPHSIPLALDEVEALVGAGKPAQAKAALLALVKRIGPRDPADRNHPQNRRLTALAETLSVPLPGHADDPWPPNDRYPRLSSLGPLTWEPPRAPVVKVRATDGKTLELGKPGRKPTLLLFNLGKDCIHCNQQILQFAKEAPRFKEMGLDVVVVTNQTPEKAKASLAEYAKEGIDIPFPLATDPDLTAFGRYGVVDEFEGHPLHGTFLIDGEGAMRWRDVESNPFLDTAFLKGEIRRLLGLGLRKTPR